MSGRKRAIGSKVLPRMQNLDKFRVAETLPGLGARPGNAFFLRHLHRVLYWGASPPPPSPPPPPPTFQAEESMAWLPLVEACSMGSTPATTVMAVAASGVWPSVATTMTMLPLERS